ncbi:MAG: PilN domain-containing protein [Shewanella sp.]
MKTKINLFNEDLLPPKLLLSFQHLVMGSAALLAIGVLMVTFASYWINHQQQLQTQQAIASELQTQVQTMERQLAERKPDPALVAEVDLLTQRLRVKQLLLTELDRRSTITSEGFSPLMTELASVPQQGVWLSKIEVQGQAVSLYGFALKAENVPTWIDELKQTSSLQGYAFSAMTMLRDDAKPLSFSLTSQPEAPVAAAGGVGK